MVWSKSRKSRKFNKRSSYRKKGYGLKRGNRNRFRKNMGSSTRFVITKGIPVPDRYFCKMKYAMSPQSPAAANPVIQVFRGNSLFDPDFTAAGHQPYGFDQFSALYERYRVRGCKIQVDISTESSSAAGNIMGFIYAKDASATGYGFTQLLEMPNVKVFRPQPLNASGRGYVKAYFSTKHILGLNKLSILDDDYSALTSTNPAMEWYIHVALYSTDNSTSIDITMNARLTYYVEFFNKAEIAQS